MRRLSADNRRLFSMTWPVILELLFTSIINTGTQYFMNAYSKNAVAVVGSLSQSVSLVLNLYSFISIGGSILLAPKISAGKKQESGLLIKTLVLGNVVFSLGVSAVTVACSTEIMKAMHIEPSLFGLGREYLLVCLGLSCVQALLMTLTAIVRSFGWMRSVLVANTTEFLLCFLINACIHFGVPQDQKDLWMYAMAGIAGQAASAVILLIVLSHSFWRNPSFQDPSCDMHLTGKIFWKNMKEILTYGVPGGLESFVYAAFLTAMSSLIGILGTTALLVKAYVAIFASYIEICVSGINTAVFVLFGQNLGLKNYKGLRKTYKSSIALGLIMTVAIGAVVMAIATPILRSFDAKEAVIRMTLIILVWQIVEELVKVPAAIAISGLKAIGSVRIPFLAMCIGGTLGFAIAYVVGIRMNFGLYGIWLGYIGDLGFRLVFACTIWHKKTTDEALAKVKL